VTRLQATTTLLIVDDEPLVLDALAKLLPEDMRCLTARSLDSAVRLIDSGHKIHGLAVDVALGGDSGLEVLERWQARSPEAPAVVMTGYYADPTFANHACMKLCRFLAKPFRIEEFRAFCLEVQASRWGVSRFIAPQFMAFVSRHGLSSGQAEILSKYAANVPRRRIARLLDITENTLRDRVRGMLKKVGVATLEDAYDQMLDGG